MELGLKAVTAASKENGAAPTGSFVFFSVFCLRLLFGSALPPAFAADSSSPLLAAPAPGGGRGWEGRAMRGVFDRLVSAV